MRRLAIPIRLKIRRAVRTTGRTGTDASPTEARPASRLAVERLEHWEPGRGIAWTPVSSSWIEALRWVPTEREGNRRYATGFIDMRTKDHAYRYGPGIKQQSWQTWLVAASRGKYWWRYFTRRWSPARKLW